MQHLLQNNLKNERLKEILLVIRHGESDTRSVIRLLCRKNDTLQCIDVEFSSIVTALRLSGTMQNSRSKVGIALFVRQGRMVKGLLLIMTTNVVQDVSRVVSACADFFVRSVMQFSGILKLTPNYLQSSGNL